MPVDATNRKIRSNFQISFFNRTDRRKNTVIFLKIKFQPYRPTEKYGYISKDSIFNRTD